MSTEPTLALLQGRVAELENILAQRDRDDAKAAEEKAAKQIETGETERSRIEAQQRTSQVEALRRGAWINYQITNALPAAALDPMQILSGIPAHGWPNGMSESDVVVQSGPLDSGRGTRYAQDAEEIKMNEEVGTDFINNAALRAHGNRSNKPKALPAWGPERTPPRPHGDLGKPSGADAAIGDMSVAASGSMSLGR